MIVQAKVNVKSMNDLLIEDRYVAGFFMKCINTIFLPVYYVCDTCKLETNAVISDFFSLLYDENYSVDINKKTAEQYGEVAACIIKVIDRHDSKRYMLDAAGHLQLIILEIQSKESSGKAIETPCLFMAQNDGIRTQFYSSFVAFVKNYIQSWGDYQGVASDFLLFLRRIDPDKLFGMAMLCSGWVSISYSKYYEQVKEGKNT